MAFIYHKPASVVEALALMALSPGKFPLLAGGTDLVVQLRTGAIAPEGLIDIFGLRELSGITLAAGHIEIGALSSHFAIAAHEGVRKHFPALAEACRAVGGAQVQNMGTIGGNVMNASPAGDAPPVLVAYDAEFIAKNLRGDRAIRSDDFFVSYRKTALAPEELLASIRIPIPEEGEFTRFYKIGARRAQAISKASICLRGRITHGGIDWIRIALGSMGPTVVRALGTESLLAGKVINSALVDKARRSLADELAPIDDVRSTADYRKYAVVGLLMRYLREATARMSS